MFPGKGTSDKPYILTGERFTGEERVYITGTSKHFTIKDCFFESCSSSGISLVRIHAHGTIKIINCTFQNSEIGILIDFAEGVTITNCSFDTNTVAVYSFDGWRLNLTNNIVKNNQRGFVLREWWGAISCDSNFFYNSSHYGLYITGSELGFHITNNEFIEDMMYITEYAIESTNDLGFSTFENNTFDGKLSRFYKNKSLLTIADEYSVIWLYKCNSVVIKNQNMSKVLRGIIAIQCNYLSISDSNFSEVTKAITTYDCANVSIDNVKIEGEYRNEGYISSMGIKIRLGDNCSINNSYISSLDYGVYYSTLGIQYNITNSNFIHCSFNLFFESSFNDQNTKMFISECLFLEGKIGVEFYSIFEVTISNNIFINQTSIVFDIFGCTNLSICFNYIDLRAGALETDIQDCDSVVYENNTVIS